MNNCRSFFLLILLFGCLLEIHAGKRYWVSDVDAAWNNTANWSTTSNGAGGSSVPGASDTVYFDANGTGYCTLDVNATMGAISISSGYPQAIDLAGFTFVVNGAGDNSFAGSSFDGNATTDSVVVISTGRTTFSGTTFNVKVNATSGRLQLSGSTFNSTSVFEKTGATNDWCTGGNKFVGNATFKNSSSASLSIANANTDSCMANVTVLNTGTHSMYFARGTATHYVGGNLTTVNSSTGTSSYYIFITGNAGTILNVEGLVTVVDSGSGTKCATMLGYDGTTNCDSNVIMTNSHTAASSSYMRIASLPTSVVNIAGNVTATNTAVSASTAQQTFIGYDGDVNITGNVITDNISSSSNAHMVLGQNESSLVDVTGNVDMTNSGSGTLYSMLGKDGDVNVGGTVDMDNAGTGTNSYVRIAYDTMSAVTITGTSTILNTKSGGSNSVCYLGRDGDVVFNGVLNINNSSTSSNSSVYLNDRGTSVNAYNNNVTLQSTNASSDGILFGNSGGSGTLANTRTITISGGSGNFIGGQLYFRNFTQTGTTAQSITLGSGSSYIYNYNCNWGGAVDFRSPRVFARGTTFSGTSRLEKTGGTADNLNVGGNTFTGIATLVNSGTADLTFGDGVTDTYTAGASIINSGTADFYFAKSGAGHAVPVFTATNSGTAAGNGSIFIAEEATAVLTISTSSVVTNSSTGGTTKQIFVGNLGDVVYNGTASFVNSSTCTDSEIYVNYGASSTSDFNDDITVQSTNASSDGILFGFDGGSSDLATGKTITVSGGSGNFIGGQLYFYSFVQNGATAQSITLGSGSSYIYNYNCSWGGNVDFRSPRVFARGTTFSGTCRLEKTGGTADDLNVGGNTFTGNVTLVNSGSASLTIGNNVTDTYSSSVTLINSGTSNFHFATAGAGHAIAGDLTATNSATGGSRALYISDNATANLTISGDANIVNSGAGTTQSTYFGDDGDITVTGFLTIENSSTATTSNMFVANGSGSTVTVTGKCDIDHLGAGGTKNTYFAYQGDVTVGSTARITNNSSATTSSIWLATVNTSSLTFSGTTDVSHLASGTTAFVVLGSNGDITFDNTLTLSNSGTVGFIVLQNGSDCSNQYNGNIVMSSSNSAGGILFGHSGASGVGVLAATRTIAVQANDTSNYTGGNLFIDHLTTTGATDQTIYMSKRAGTFTSQNCTWGGGLDVKAPRINIGICTIGGSTSIEKWGTLNDFSGGLNTYNGDVTFTNSGTGNFAPEWIFPSDYNGNVTYVKTGTGLMQPSLACASTYAGNITVNSSTAITFGGGGGLQNIIFDGTVAQSIDTVGGTPAPIFTNLQVNNPNFDVTLNTPISINGVLDLDQGCIISSSDNLLTMNDGSSLSSSGEGAFVSGPMRKIGDDAFTFPIGKNDTAYAPITITAPSVATDHFTAEYFQESPHTASAPGPYLITSLESGINNVSGVEYWTLDRTGGTSNVSVTLSWDDRSSTINDSSDLIVTRWDGAEWKDHGATGLTGTNASGTITTSAAVTSFSPFALGSSSPSNPLPIKLVSFTAVGKGDRVDLSWVTASEMSNDYFTVEKSLNAKDWEVVLKVDGAGNSNYIISYSDVDYNPYEGISYYRLKQTDWDGTFAYSNIVPVSFGGNESSGFLTLFPNPVREGQTINLTLEEKNTYGELLVVLKDIQGREVYSKVVLKIEDNQLIAVPLDENIPAGIYMVIATSNDLFYSQKLIVR